ncbi:polysaccharide biosynthesis/export family protein [Oceaniglobus ichthyenteri]|uniref:polysaccharide biosynthesis/export family protein n=1 Tax=Oceaniglobus ichthyenteri TaxID=2136177 RepID=UPI000D33AC72|nr:polysaccharide biosynthesis/export family protein [Oceaniglobus ichthyenteri]
MNLSRACMAASLSAFALIAGCTTLPQGAALRSDITKGANTVAGDVAFYPVTRALLPTVATWPRTHTEQTYGWFPAHSGSTGQIIAAGDTVTIRIWDSQENSLLLAVGERVADLGNMRVSPSGQVFVPYVGDVRIAGMGPDRARRALQERLSVISPSAQAQLTLTAGRQNTVDLVSGVASPGSYPMEDRNLSVLALISQGGGVPPTMRNPRVKVQRGGKTYATSIDSLYANPRLDAILVGGDKVIVEDDERFFLSLGAAGKEAVVPFDKEDITALEAISMIGGIADTRADPKGILVLREYPRSALSAGARGPRNQRVVFAIDMTSADGLFSAKNLEIQSGDVVLATESAVTRFQTIAGLIGTGFGLVGAVSNSND